MKQSYFAFQRCLFYCAIALLLTSLSSINSVAQQAGSYEEGVFRIKVSEELAAQLEGMRATKRADDVLFTGIASIDNVNQQLSVKGIKRVFRPAGKFEEKHRRYGLHRWYEVEMSKASSVLTALNAFKSIERVEKVEPVYRKSLNDFTEKDKVPGPTIASLPDVALGTLPGVPNDPFLANQWHYNNTGQQGGTPGADIKLFQAWGIETGSSNVIVAITDGGIQANHPDLAANMWVNTGETPGNGIDDDNNGYVDDINGYGFGDDTTFIAPNGHGTHVGGTVAATTNNGIGVAGVAGGSGAGDGARVMSLAAFGANDNGGFAETYVYGADNGAVISQNSWGYTNPNVFEQAVLDGIDYFIAEAGKDSVGNQVGPMMGGIVIFAAGNSGTNNNWYPGIYESALAVAATTNQDRKAYYSNFGPWVDIAAPGGETITVAQRGVLSTTTTNQYAYFQGTSMACPHVSGVAALIISKFGGTGFTPAMLRARLVQTTDNIDAVNPTFIGQLGSGRLNAFAALQQANDSIPPVTITDLGAPSATNSSVVLTWTAPSDAGNSPASSYDIRYSLAPITEGNFGTATPVPSTPTPKAPGSLEEFVVSGLSSATLYYFAIKSADFFGNTSAISNIASRSTENPPEIELSPTFFTEALLTGGTSSQILYILNKGTGPLSFSIAVGGSENFVSPTITEGTVRADTLLEVAINFNAAGLLAGTYQTDLFILSNDPVNDTLVVPITLVVTNNGVPIASVQPDTLDFGAVFIGRSVTENITVHNAGSDSLSITAVQSDNPDFAATFSAFLNVNPFDSAKISITYTASVLGVTSGTLSIHSNDPLNPILNVGLQGEGLDAPSITVTPDSLSESLNTGNTSTQHLTIKNSGNSNLEFAIAISSPGASVATIKKIDLSSQGAVSRTTAIQKQVASPARKASPQLTVKSVGTTAGVSKVLIITSDSDVTDLADILNSFGDIEATIFPVASLPGITLADLIGYDVVTTTNNTQWLGAGNVDPVVIGNLLADYIDQGGKVISNQFAYSYDAWKMAGRFIDEQYGPFIPSTTDANISTSLGTILSPSHPVMQGVSSLSYEGFVQNVTISPGATALANWANGQLFIAANSNVVALNALPSLGNGDPLQWEGDLPTIYQNAIHWLAGPSFVSVAPEAGTVLPGSQLDIAVTFNASGLAAGLHKASIDITSNDPSRQLISVPASLTVLGAQFTVTPDSLYQELEKNKTKRRTLILTNNGTVDQRFEISINTVGDSVKNQKSVYSSTAIEKTARVAGTTTARIASVETRTSASAVTSDLTGIEAIANPAEKNKNQRQAASVVQNATNLYATDFESFTLGDIQGQGGWTGQFGNWTIEAENAASGQKHYRSVSDGLGQSRSFSPRAPLGTDAISTATMKVNVTGGGVSWQITPQSPSAGFVNTRIRINIDGTVDALVKTPTGTSVFARIPATIPSGYFDLTIEITRATAVFNVYFNEQLVFTGLGFAGSIEQVVMLSPMELEGSTFDMDDFKIIDGKKEAPPFIRVLPVSGNLHAGQSLELNVDFNSTGLAFGAYPSDIVINMGATTLNVPALLRVIGDPAIEVSDSVLHAVVPYKGDTTKYFDITNTGGRELTYSLSVIGADTGGDSVRTVVVSKLADVPMDLSRQQKIAKDIQQSAVLKNKPTSIQLLAGTSLLQEEFEGGTFPPAGWSTVDNEASGVEWSFAAIAGEGNYSGSGEAATISSDVFGPAEFDAELITPVISVRGFRNIAVQYNVNYQNLANLDFLDLDIQLTGETTWTNVIKWNEDHGTFRNTPGEFVTVELDEFIGNASSFRLRWHYYDPNIDDWDWYAQVDNVQILGDARRWVTVSPATGIIPVGGTASIKADFTAIDLEAGLYVGSIIVDSNAPVNSPVGIVASLQVLNPAEINFTPDSLYQELMIGETAKQVATIFNTGESPLKFSITDRDEAAKSTLLTQPKERRKSVSTRTTPTVSTLRLDDRAAILQPVSVSATGVPLYSTGFEEFATGDIQGQEGWAGQFGNWTIETANPFAGAQHFRGLSDALGQSLAFSPTVSGGTDPISSTTMMINADSAATTTWQIIPQSNSDRLVNTRFEFGASGALRALVLDSAGNGFYQPIAASIPSGYFEFRIDVERATSLFTIYFNSVKIFSGQGFAGDIEQVVILSPMETAGPVFDIDDIAIIDGSPESSWLSYYPRAGTVAPGSSLDVVVAFDATDLEEGIYRKVLNIASNDPATPTLSVPVVLNAMDNDAPVLAEISDTTVVETETMRVTFTATDEDDASIKVALLDAPSFITVVSYGNGTTTYAIHPKLGDAGEYNLTVIAQDPRGERDSALFRLTVVPYGVGNFSLINIQTGQVILDFEDSVTVDVADPLYTKYVIRANTAPKKVGSVRFKVDGRKINIENREPYLLNRLVLPLLRKGTHSLLAESFTKKDAKGEKAGSSNAVIIVTNSAAVTGFEVVNKRGTKLMNIGNGGKINIRQSGFNHITVVAKVAGKGIGSVRFDLNGKHYHTENFSPYSLTGGAAGFFEAWNPKPGHYTLKATPYSEVLGLGIAGESVTISFDVVTKGVSVPASKGDGSIAREATPAETNEETVAQKLTIVLHPVPVKDEINLKTTGEIKGDVKLIIHSAEGKVMFEGNVPADKLNNYRINTDKLGMSKGIYYMQLINQQGVREVKKFVKE